MAVNDLNQLLKHELGDLLYAERVFLKGLKQMAKQTSNSVIADRIVQHAEETQGHIENLERAFETIGYKPRAQKCDGALGLDEERKSFMEEEEPSEEVLEAFNLGSGLRVEHYEIAGYRSAIALAKQTGNIEAAQYLNQNLEQEVAMARFIEEQSSSALQNLGQQLGTEEEED
jgi:ferritin-like metal-binding protein YciE